MQILLVHDGESHAARTLSDKSLTNFQARETLDGFIATILSGFCGGKLCNQSIVFLEILHHLVAARDAKLGDLFHLESETQNGEVVGKILCRLRVAQDATAFIELLVL